MRLLNREISGIVRGLKELPELADGFALYLFGSRADDTKRGGDIDLLLVVSSDRLADIQMKKHMVIAKAKKYIEDQKIDITIQSSESLELGLDPFLESIKEELIPLYP